MAQAFPYTYYSCDCYDTREKAGADEDERTFDPRNPRSNYALYPLEHLLYCEDCQQIRCPRCVTEETLNWFCPNCLFEVPSSVVKSDGNRCTRNCYNCPVCTAPMSVSTLEDPANPSPSGGPYILSCGYCHWSTVEIGIEFEKSTGITAQLARIANGGGHAPTPKEREKERERRKDADSRRARDAVTSPSEDSQRDGKDTSNAPPTHDDMFADLHAFYKDQLAAHTPSHPFSAQDINYSSPSSFSRIMSIYATTASSRKHKRDKPALMREASSTHEGLILHDATSDTSAIDRIKRDGWSTTLSPAQKTAQSAPNARFEDQLRPIATLLRTRRGKRCRSCRHILSKPESKITSTRYKIKLLALNHIPRLSIRALPTPTNSTSTPPLPSSSSFNMPSSSSSSSNLAAPSTFNYDALSPSQPTHFLLHISNPLFDPIRVTLATPSITPGPIASRVTILCPQFDVGANTDVWDDALSGSVSPVKRGSVTSVGGGLGRSGSVGGAGTDGGQAEAGKIWDRGRNWTSVVMEIVPGFLGEGGFGASVGGSFGGFGASVGGSGFGGRGSSNAELDEDDDVLEIPIFVRIEFEADVNAEERGLGDSRGNKGEREKREEAFWTVVGVGRIAG
jgi:dynactin-4